MIKGAPVDLTGFLFGDVFAVTTTDVAVILLGGAGVLAVVAWMWQPLLRLAVHEDLATAEGVDRETVRTVFIVLLAVTIAVAMKIVGILLVMAFLVVPAVAARPLSRTPERMVLLTALIAAGSVLAGLWLSATVDSPGGPSIVIVMSVVAGLSLSWAAFGRPGGCDTGLTPAGPGQSSGQFVGAGLVRRLVPMAEKQSCGLRPTIFWLPGGGRILSASPA